MKYCFAFILCVLYFQDISGQQETDCDPRAKLAVTQGEVDFNYGSVTNSFSFRNRSSLTVAQTVVGNGIAKDFTAQSGFWARFLLPPQAPQIQSSQGDFPDRVLISWNLDPLSSEAAGGYVITRDGAFLAQVDRGIKQFIDFNVQPGEFYEYGVYGRNQFGNGTQGKAIGFVNPNGVVTGRVETFSRNPVAGAIVTLSPSKGNSLLFDGINDYLCVTHKQVVPTNMWTVSAWVKIAAGYNSDGIVDLGSDLNKNFWLHTTPSGSGKGVVAGVGTGAGSTTLSHEFSTNPDGWHHVAAVYAGGSLLLYVDGAFVSSGQSSISNEAALFTIGSRRNQTGFFHGRIDDVRLYNRPLTGSDIFLTKDITVSKSTPGLMGYWKFDEGLGTRVFDISSNKMHAFMNGPQFSDDTPNIQNAGMTDVGGFYAIEGVNYSQVQTFTATPSKVFYSNYALEFNSAYQSHVMLTDFDLPDSATVEVVLQPFDIQNRQTILNNGIGNFELWIQSGQLKLTINGQTQDLGPALKSYQHLSLTLDGVNNVVKFYRNGNLENTLNYTGITGNWTGSPWMLGARNATPTDFYTGLIDEVAFYKAALSQADVQLNASTFGSGGTNTGHPDLLSFFSLDEATGNEVEDTGAAMTGFGQISNAFFSIITYRQKESPHSFRPSQRLVNINSSNTAATGIDFVDESTLTVSGVVRFSNTFCYQDSVEILVNGQPAFPPIFTNSDGRFVADFEPGVTVKLSPRFGDHKFSPAFYEVRRLNRPIAGVLFQNTVKREMSGQMAGGLCRKSVIPDGGFAVVKVEALNACFVKYDTIASAAGNYAITGIPPIPVAVAVTYHSNNTIYQYFNNQGGSERDLRKKERDTVDFIYIAPPQVYIKPFEENGCVGSGVKLLDQSSPKNNYREYFTDIRVFESYDGGLCYLDSFNLTIENDIADQSATNVMVEDTTIYKYRFFAGIPNLGPPHQKLLQVTAHVNGSSATSVETVVVLGERSRESTFTTSSPAMPMIILRDPPGDKSNSVLTKGTKHCQTWSDGFIIDNTTGIETSFSLGPIITTYSGSPFGGVITKSEVTSDEVISGSFQSKIGEKTALEVCMTNEKEYATSSDGVVIGEEADLFVGAAVNFEFSATDILSYNPDNCSFPITQSVRVNPKSFGTTYIYSDYQIKNDVIPSNEFIGDTVSADAWRRILQYNKNLKKDATFKKNISFDALTNYSETVASSSSNSYEFSYDLIWSAEYNNTLGFEVMGIGTKVKIGHKLESTFNNTSGSNNESNRSVKYTLGDDDLGDNFTVDVLDDPVFGTPVFKLRAGESMCPWEPGTLNREEVGFSIDRLTAVNVPEKDAAPFRLRLSNLGQTAADQLVYTMGKVPGGNPDAAYIQLDGAEFGGNVNVQLGPFQTKNYLMAVSRGPVEYTYTNVGIFAASTCQLEHALAYGYDLSGAYSSPNVPFQGPYKKADLNKFYKEYRINVQFLEPCSPIDIGFPMQDWVITPADNEVLFITLNNYLYNDPDLELVRVQYRRTGGDGAWINIAELPKSEFANSPVFKIVQWDMSELADGPYEIRAITQCFDVGLPPGISQVIKGRKETKPPKLFGQPQPADGVLSPGDEISVTFSKRINCTEVFQADGIGSNFNLNNIALLDMTAGGILIDALISCKDEKIVIVPNIPNQFIENHILRAVATDIKDLYGNPADQVLWEFYVNRSNLYWHGGDIDEVVYEGNQLMVTREIRNQSGQRTTFRIDDYPDWMEIFPLEGGLDPGGIMQVRFIFPSNLVNGFYNTTINMTTVDGNEPLKVDLRVACKAPEWELDPTAYSYSMNLTLQPNIEGTLSTDRLDLVGAFVNGQLRGIGKVQYFRSLNKYLVFLTVYSNVVSGETITFQIWDASACLLYGQTVETFTFVADDLIGSPITPAVIYTNNLVLRKVQIHPGWNWISYNVNLPNPTVNAALATMTKPQGGLIKGQTAFSIYSSGINSWVGSLGNLSHLTMYQLNASAFDSISFVGTPVDPSTPIPLFAGWNWIGYLPQYGLPVTQALASLSPLNGDIIKSQLHFAQYVAGVGWVGNLGFLSPPNGYLIKLSNNGTLQYPGNNIQDDPNINALQRQVFTQDDLNRTDLDRKVPVQMNASRWSVNPQQYEYNMNIIAIVSPGNESANLLDANDEVGVFVGQELRGMGNAIYIPALNKYMVFITVYANQVGELLSFKWYDASENAEYDLVEKTGFQVNGIWGMADNPVVLHLTGTSSTNDNDADIKFRMYPNPTANYLYIEFESAVNEEMAVKVVDMLGKEVRSIPFTANSGINILEWNHLHEMNAGVYWVRLSGSRGEVSRKLTIIR